MESGGGRKRTGSGRGDAAVACARRAAALVRARKPEQVGASGLERRVVLATNRWYGTRGGAQGLAVGLRSVPGDKRAGKRAGGKTEVGLVVFVKRKKPRSKVAKGRLIADAVRTGGGVVPVRVVELVRCVPEAAVSVGAGTQTPGTVTLYLRDEAAGTLYGLSAAHVLAQSPLSGGRWRYGRPFDAVYRNVHGGATPTVCGRLVDRSVPDWDNIFPTDSVDAALYVLDDPGEAVRLNRPIGRAALGDVVRVIGATSGAGSAAGVVTAVDFGTERAMYPYAHPSGQLRKVNLAGLCLAEYQSAGGDSGGLVVRERDGAAVGMHIGRLVVRTGEAGAMVQSEQRMFLPLERVLGRWAGLRVY